jgi:hypothetical protein
MIPPVFFSREPPPLTRREVVIAAISLAVVMLVITFPALVGNELAAAADGPRLYYPFQYHAWSMLARGELPTWSNTVGGGFPIMASSQVVMFYPPNWIFGLFRNPVAYNVVTLLHAWIAGVGMYVLARCFKTSVLAALVAALIMVFGASIAARIAAGHIGELFNRAWMPWQLVAIYFLSRRPNGWRAMALGVVFGLTLLAGASGYQVVMYTGILSAVWGVYWLLAQHDRAQRALFAVWCAVAMVLGAGLSAVQTLPTADLLGQGNRQVRLSDDDLNVAALPVPMVLGFALPHTFDDATITDYIWPEYATYAGAATLALALYALRRRSKDPLVRVWGGVALIFLLLAFGLQSPLFRLVIEVFPPYTLVRNPARHLAVVQLALAMLAAMGLDTLLDKPLAALGRRRIRWLIAGIALMVVITVLAATRSIEAEKSWDVFPERLLRGAIWFAAALAAFLLSIQLVRAAKPESRVQRAAFLLVIGVIALDLVLYARPMFDGERPPGHLEYVTRSQFPTDYLVAFDEQDATEAANVVQAADGGALILNVYSSILPERAVRASNLLAGRPADTYLENHIELVDVARPNLLDMFGVRWLLFEPDQAVFADNTLHELRDEGVVRVYENTDALPVAHLVPEWTAVTGPEESIRWLEDFTGDFREEAVIEGDAPAEAGCASAKSSGGERPGETSPGPLIALDSYAFSPLGWVSNRDDQMTDAVTGLTFSGGNIHLKVQTSGSRLLVINQTHVDGWRAWVNGASSTVYPANHRWLGVYVPCAGTYEVHLQYLPHSLQIGAAVSLVTLAGIVLVLGAQWLRRLAWRARA